MTKPSLKQRRDTPDGGVRVQRREDLALAEVGQHHVEGRPAAHGGPEVLLRAPRQLLQQDVVPLEVKVHHICSPHLLHAIISWQRRFVTMPIKDWGFGTEVR